VELSGLSHVLAATGRKPNVRHLALEAAGVRLDEKTGAITVDEFSKTSVDSVYAVGDVTDRINLTPIALMEGMAFARNAFGGDKNAKPDYGAVASAVFSTPTISTVGLTEEEAVAREGGKKRTLVFSSSFKPMKNTISGSEGRALMKLVVCGETDKVRRKEKRRTSLRVVLSFFLLCSFSFFVAHALSFSLCFFWLLQPNTHEKLLFRSWACTWSGPRPPRSCRASPLLLSSA
jgi:hypothetical protein